MKDRSGGGGQSRWGWIKSQQLALLLSISQERVYWWRVCTTPTTLVCPTICFLSPEAAFTQLILILFAEVATTGLMEELETSALLDGRARLPQHFSNSRGVVLFWVCCLFVCL